MWAIPFVVVMKSKIRSTKGDARMYDLRWVPIVVEVSRGLAFSAMPDAPVVPDAPRRERRRLRGAVGRLVAARPRLQATRLGEEEPCGT